MSRFHQPRLLSAIVFALLCVNSSLASPVADAGRSRVSIIAASEPVYIIPSKDLPSEPFFPSGGSTTSNDGTTVTTTFNNRRKLARRRDAASVVSASEPVNVIPTDDLPPGRRLHDGNSSSTTTNDGTTVTTTYTAPRTLLQSESNDTGSINLLNVKNHTLALSELDMGLNCQGSLIMCVGSTQMGVMHTLRDYTYAIPVGYRYFAGQDIACMKHNVYPNPWITWGFYCVFMQGNIPAEGVDGAEIQLKLQQLIEHHCLGCGSVPFSNDNDPHLLGILTVNYVRQSECEGLCYYKPPGIAANAAVEVPKNMTLASS